MGSAVNWISANAQWLFSGVGVLVLTTAFVILRSGYRRWRESRAGVSDAQEQLSHAQVGRRPLQSRLPGVLLRVLHKPDDIRQQVVIGLRDNAPGALYLGNPIPSVDLYFQITNLSPIDLVLDRALVDVWFGQPTFTVALLHRYSVPAGEITTGIHVRQMLSENQKAYIQAFEAATRGSVGQFHVYITAYFESKLGRFFVQTAINRDRLI
jgi:hypothetical protein